MIALQRYGLHYSVKRVFRTAYRRASASKSVVTNSQCLYSQINKRWMSTRLEEKGPSHLYHNVETPLLRRTMGRQLDEAVEKWPNRECIVSVHQNIRLTFTDVQRRVNRLAAGFAKLGLRKGDCFCIWAPNYVEWFLTFLACSKIGLITVGTNPFYQQAEIEYCLQKVNAKAVVALSSYRSHDYATMLLKAKEKCPNLEHIIIISNDYVTGTRRFADVESLASEKEVQAVQELQENVSPDSPCNIQFTSGTTGKPKATTLSHMSMVNNARQVAQRLNLDQKHNKICANVPLFHAFGMIACQIADLHSGATIVLEGPQFNPVNSLKTIVNEKCTVLNGTPTMWINVMETQHKLNFPIESLSRGLIGGAPASPDIYKNIRTNLHFEHIKSIYGLTECTAVAFQSLPEELYELTDNTVGYLSDHVEALVVDDKGVPVPFDTPGELWVRGYNVMLRYWGDEKNTKATITKDGWLKTGDQFILRRDGYGVIVGRLKDIIIRGGENIFPKEIEDFFMTHPAVAEVHVFGAHDDTYGEEICAAVKLNTGVKISETDLRNYGKGKISHWKIPRYVVFVDNFPKTGSGKIQKFLLKEEMESRGVIPTKPKH